MKTRNIHLRISGTTLIKDEVYESASVYYEIINHEIRIKFDKRNNHLRISGTTLVQDEVHEGAAV